MGSYIPNDVIIAALKKHKGWQHKTADEIGCNRRTIERAVKERDEVRKVYRDLVERRHDKVEAKLQDAIDDGNIAAIIFYLKTQAKGRGYVERQEHDVDLTGKIELDPESKKILKRVYGNGNNDST